MARLIEIQAVQDLPPGLTVRVGDRIAQLVVQHHLHGDFTSADSLPDSARGDTGHGSTGGFGPTDPR